MALTDEQKIIIGVCVGVAGLILLAIIIFVLCLFCGTKKHRRHHRRPYKERIIEDRYYDDRKPYTVYEKTVPPAYDYVPPPPPMPPPEVYYKKPAPRSVEVVRYNDDWDRRSADVVKRRYYSDNGWDGVFHNDPIVVPAAEPEVLYSDERRRDPDVIYLKYVDDQALLPRENHSRRVDYVGGGGGPALRRSRSFHDLRRSEFVGEWNRRPDNLNRFNENALRAGRDPFLWN